MLLDVASPRGSGRAPASRHTHRGTVDRRRGADVACSPAGPPRVWARSRMEGERPGAAGCSRRAALPRAGAPPTSPDLPRQATCSLSSAVTRPPAQRRAPRGCPPMPSVTGTPEDQGCFRGTRGPGLALVRPSSAPTCPTRKASPSNADGASRTRRG